MSFKYQRDRWKQRVIDNHNAAKRPQEFTGTYSQLAQLATKHGGTMRFEARVIIADTKLYVDSAGTIYAPGPSDKLTVVVGRCT